MNISFLANYTQELIVKQFEKDSNSSNLNLNIYTSGFNQYRQEIINETSLL